MPLAEALPRVTDPTAQYAYWREAFKDGPSWDEARLATQAAWDRVSPWQ